MSILQFHAFCSFLWDEETNEHKKWRLWEGVRGYPGQGEVLEAFATEKYNWLLKARQLGGDESVAFASFHQSVTIPNSETDFISKDFPAAKYFLKRRLLRQMEKAYSMEYAPGKRYPWPKYDDNSDTGKVKWENGSFVEAFSSDNQAVRSRSPRLVVLNEVRTFSTKDAEEIWTAITATVDAHPSRRSITLSTAAFGSWFNVMTKKLMDGEVDGVRFLFLPSDTNPERDEEWRVLGLSRATHPSLFLQEFPMEPEDCFIGREGAVFRAFDNNVGGRHVNPVKLDWKMRFCIGYDHGKQHPAVLLLCLYDRYTDHLYVFDEVFCRGLDLPEVTYAMKEKLNYYKNTHLSPEPIVKVADSAIFAETGQKTIAAEIHSLMGIWFTPSHKPGRQFGMDRINSRFTNGRLTIDPRCVQTRKQIEELQYKRQPGEPRAEEIIAVEDDAPSVLAYLDAELNPGMKPKPKTQSLEIKLMQRQRVKEMAKRGMSTGADALGGGGVFWG